MRWGNMNPAHEVPIGFMSYAHFTSPQEQAKLDALRERLETEVYNQTGDPFRIFQDRRDIQWGEAWERRIETSIDSAAFLIPILTPAFFKSSHCRAELARFIRRERQLGSDQLIRPIYYITCQELEDDDRANGDQLIKTIATRQYADFRKFRFSNVQSAVYARNIAEIAEMLAGAIRKSRIYPSDQSLASGIMGERMELASVGDGSAGDGTAVGWLAPRHRFLMRRASSAFLKTGHNSRMRFCKSLQPRPRSRFSLR